MKRNKNGKCRIGTVERVLRVFGEFGFAEAAAHFICKRLNIILAGNPHSFGSPGKGGLRFSDCFRRSVAYNDFPVLFPVIYALNDFLITKFSRG